MTFLHKKNRKNEEKIKNTNMTINKRLLDDFLFRPKKVDQSFHGFLKLKNSIGNSKGFSLISAVIAAGLLGLGVLALSSTLIAPQRETQFVNQQFASASLKHTVLQSLGNAGFCPCQFEFANNYGINTNQSTAQSLSLSGLKNGCGPNSDTLASPGQKLAPGITVNTITLENILTTGSTDEYSGDLIVSYSGQQPGEQLKRSINPINIPVLLTVDPSQGNPSSRPFLACGAGAPPPPLLGVTPTVEVATTTPKVQIGCENIDGSVRQGHLHTNGGGFVANTATVHPDAWVGPGARVCGYARVTVDNSPPNRPRIEHGAIVSGTAHVHGSALVSGDARVSGGEVYGNAKVLANALVSQRDSSIATKVFGDAKICGHSIVIGGEVYENALICGTAQISGGKVYGTAKVICDARVSGGEVYGNAKVAGKAHVYGNARVFGEKTLLEDDAEVYGDARVYSVNGEPTHTDSNLESLSTDKTVIHENARVFGNAIVVSGMVGDEAKVSGGIITRNASSPRRGRPFVGGKAEITGGVISTNKHVGIISDIHAGKVTKISGGTISGNAIIDGNAEVSGGTITGGRVSGNAEVSGGTITGGRVSGNAIVSGGQIGPKHPQIYGNAQVSGGTIQDWARVYGYTLVSGGIIRDHAMVYGSNAVNPVKVEGTAQIRLLAKVYEEARVYGKAQVHGLAWVYGQAKVYDDAQVYGNARVSGTNTRIYDDAKVSGIAQVSGGDVNGSTQIDSGQQLH